MNDLPSVQSDRKVAVRYVGTKEVKYDNICHTRTIWHGAGDKQLVPIAVAVQLARFPKVWQIVDEALTGNTKFVATVDSVEPDTDLPAAPETRPVLKLKGRNR